MNISESSSVVQAVSSVVSAGGVCLVFWQVRKAKEVAVMQNTLAFIDSESREHLHLRLCEALAPFFDHRASYAIVDAETSEKIRESRHATDALEAYLNWWERVAVSIELKAFDEKMCRARFGRLLVSSYRRYEGVILEWRKPWPTCYVSLEKIAKKWEAMEVRALT